VKSRASITRYSVVASNLPGPPTTCDTVQWIALSSVLRPHQHSIGYMGDGFYRSKDPTNSIKVLKEKATKENPENANNKIHTDTK